MALSTLAGQFHDANYLRPPHPSRCGHICVAVDKINEFGTELIVIHGGINSNKEALADLAVLQVNNEDWLDLVPSAVGPAARAFHAACVVGPRVFIFAGHVYLPEQKRLHQFNDLWALDTETWQWHRMEASPDAPSPSSRDRASMVALDDHRLLIYGGADASNKKLDDAWIYNLTTSSWSEVSIASAKPKPRCSAALFTLGNRVLLFGGDTANAGPSNELWSLRGVHESSSPPLWTQLQLEGATPAPRRGHAAAAAESMSGILFVGGLSEQKSMLGMKKQSDYLMDIVLLHRQKDNLVWRRIDIVGSGEAVPMPREKHTVCALKDGRFFLYGGTDGTKTLGDAWWLNIEDIPPTPADLTTLSDLEKQLAVSQPVTVVSGSTPSSGTITNPDAVAIASPAPPSPQPAAAAPITSGDIAAAGSGNAAGASYWSAIPTSLPALVPQLATSALSTLKGRLGYPAGTSNDASGAAITPAMAPVGPAVDDDALVALGRFALGVDSTREDLVLAARDYLASTAPTELKLGTLTVLMDDYRRLARAGWASVLTALGPDGLSSVFEENFPLLGRYMHWSADDVRLKDVGAILEDYKALLAAAAARETTAAAAEESRPTSSASADRPTSAEQQPSETAAA